MRLEKISVRNFRLLRRVALDLAADKTTTILVGANNSGKTSVMEALKLFVGWTSDSKRKPTVHDMSSVRRKDFSHIQKAMDSTQDDEKRIEILRRFAPRIRMDLHFSHSQEPADISIAGELLMNLDPSDNRIALRIEYGIDNAKLLVKDFQNRRIKDETLFEFISDKLTTYYGMSFKKISVNGKEAVALDNGNVVKRLVMIDMISAQRHMDDEESGRAAKLSKLLHDHYYTYYKSEETDGYNSIEDAIKEMSKLLTGKYESAFSRLTKRLRNFGYPQGHSTPDMKVKAELSAETIYKDNTRIYYSAERTSLSGIAERFELPEKYNGLGYKNLIYIVLQLESFRAALEAIEADRPRVHIIAIEEPEAHLHPQMQCIFIKEINQALQHDSESTAQVILSTHSSHMVADSGFDPIRYFKRKGHEVVIRDLSRMPITPKMNDTLQFLKRYVKLTHCDLFFADKAILVEGQVERLLIPLMIGKCKDIEECARLDNQYISTLEVGGAYAHVFQPLIEFIGIPTLVITDIDAVDSTGEKCKVSAGIGSSNAALTKWIPAKPALVDLMSANDGEKTCGHIRVAYQMTENGSCGRSFEEAFIYANVDWLTNNHSRLLATGSKIKKAIDSGLVNEAYDLSGKIAKVDFALDLVKMNDWNTPSYILSGLKWLGSQEALE